MEKVQGKNSILTILLCLLIFFSIATHLHSDWLDKFDKSVIHFIQSGISRPLTVTMKTISFIGSVRFITILTAALSIFLFFSRKFILGLYLLLSVAFGAGVFNQYLKALFKRERPDNLRLGSEHGFSFPSGHAMGMVIFFGGLLFILYQIKKDKRNRKLVFTLAIFFIILVGISRIYLGVHYPSDIIGGYAISLIWLQFSFFLYDKFLKKG